MKTHFAVSYTNKYGGYNTTTLCGRMSAKCDDSINSETNVDDVTCDICHRTIGDTKNWRWRKHVESERTAKQEEK